MPSEDSDRIVVLQGTLDLIVLRMLQTMGRQHAYAIATRLQQVSEDLLQLNQGTLYPALVRMEQDGRIKGTWAKPRATATPSSTPSPKPERRRSRRKPSAGAAWQAWSKNCSLRELEECGDSWQDW